MAVAAALLLGSVTGQANSTAPVALVFAAPPLVAYSVGVDAGTPTGLACVALLAFGLQAGSAAFNPLFEMVTVGPWLAGLAVRSRRSLAGQIEMRNRELELARSAYAHEAVRYERARIARELHDVVAHCVTAIVVQAGAVRQLAASDPERAHEMLRAIVESADEAYAEIGMLGSDRPHGLDTIESLVQKAGATGQTVRYQRSGDRLAVDSATSEVAYRIVQESLTNAVKHAAGAPVEICMHALQGRVDLCITSGPTEPGRAALAATGSGRGIAGMQRRAAECGGRLTAGPAGARWQVAAHLPGQSQVVRRSE